MEPKDWITLGVGLPTFTVAALNLWLTFRNRSSTHREFLYKKQVEEYENFLEIIVKHDLEFFEDAIEKSKNSDDNAIIREAFNLMNYSDKIILFASDEVIKVVDEYGLIFNHIVKISDTKSDVDFDKITKEASKLYQVYLRLIRVMRHSLGFSELSKDILYTTRTSIRANHNRR